MSRPPLVSASCSDCCSADAHKRRRDGRTELVRSWGTSMQRFLSRLGLTVAAWVVGTIIALTGIGFMSAALYLAILDVASPAVAALSTGAAAFVVAGLIVLIGRAIVAPGGPPPPGEALRKTGTQPELAAEMGMLLGTQATSWIRSHTVTAASIALIAGFVVGASPTLRGAVRNMAKPTS